MSDTPHRSRAHLPIMEGLPPPPEWRVPRADWDRAPWNRWSFQNVRQILPTVNVRRGHGPLRPLPAALQDIGGIRFDSSAGGETSVADLLDNSYTDGFLVIVDGEVVHESYHNGMQPHTLHLAQSVSKSVVATVAGCLIGRGLLSVEAPITDYLPELAATGWAGATLQQVLDMTSGVRYIEEYTDPQSDIGSTDIASGWKAPPPGVDPSLFPASIWEQILTLEARDAEHGARFLYRSIETDVLAHAMERVTGLRLAELVSRELWQRMGAEEDACFTVDPAGYALADGGFNASLRDFARFGLLLLEGGAWNGEQIVPESWIEDIRSGAHGLFNDLARDAMPNGRYRNQFWVEDEARPAVCALGVFGQFVYIAPDYDMVAVKLSSWPDFLNPASKIDTFRAFHAIAAALGKGG